MATAVSVLVVWDSSFPVAPSRNDGNGSSVAERTTQPVGIIAFVSKELVHAPGLIEERGRRFHVAALPAVSISA